MTDSGSLATALRNGELLLVEAPTLAEQQARAILAVTPEQPGALRLLGKALRLLGKPSDAAAAELAAVRASLRNRDLVAARDALGRGDLRAAEPGIRAVLRDAPDDVVANMMLAEVAARLGILADAERLLRRARDLAPDYCESAINLALILAQQGGFAPALAELDRVIAGDPKHIRAAASKANLLAQIGDYAAAGATYRALLDHVPESAEVWMWYGHLLKTVGSQEESVAAYRHATALDAELAEAWWSLTELKANRADGADVAAMQAALGKAGDDSRRVFLHFALGKALEDMHQWNASFRHYAEGNRLRSALDPHDQAAVESEAQASQRLYTPTFFAAHIGHGDPAPDPIFVVGMPRAGSTLIEQILSCHPQIEGTAELPYIPQLVQALVARSWKDKAAAYPQLIDQLSPRELSELGGRYLESAGRHRKTNAPFFIDKLPNNWRYVGFIHTILPNAKIIDARRGAMACCFSNFKQHFARGQTFAYSLADMGAYYRTYVRAMLQIDGALPGLVHRVQHEALLDGPEREIRRLLDYLELQFDSKCLRPHENRRPVRTASSEQVRRPINRQGADQWHNYAPWLTPLRESLGDLAEL